MSDVDRTASPAAGDELSTDEGVRRFGLDLEEIARRGFDDVAAGRAPRSPRRPGTRGRRREILRALRRGQTAEQSAPPPRRVRRA